MPGKDNVDKLENLFNQLVGFWGILLSCGGALLAGHKWIRKWYRAVSRALRFSIAMHANFGANPAIALIESLRERTRDGAIREIRLTLLEESLGAGIYLCHPDTGSCFKCNTVLSELWGLDQVSFCEFGWLSAVMPDDRLAVHERWISSVRNKIPYECEYRIRNQRTGREFRVVTRAYPAVLKDGTILCYVGTVEELRGSDK